MWENRSLMWGRLSQYIKMLEYQKSLLTLDLGWSNKLSCKISAFYLENRKSCGHLKFQQATNKIKKSLISKIEFYFKKLLFLPLKIDYKVNCKSSKAKSLFFSSNVQEKVFQSAIGYVMDRLPDFKFIGIGELPIDIHESSGFPLLP